MWRIQDIFSSQQRLPCRIPSLFWTSPSLQDSYHDGPMVGFGFHFIKKYVTVIEIQWHNHIYTCMLYKLTSSRLLFYFKITLTTAYSYDFVIRSNIWFMYQLLNASYCLGQVYCVSPVTVKCFSIMLLQQYDGQLTSNR